MSLSQSGDWGEDMRERLRRIEKADRRARLADWLWPIFWVLIGVAYVLFWLGSYWRWF